MAKTYNHCTHMDLTLEKGEKIESLLSDINQHLTEMGADNWKLISTDRQGNDLLVFWAQEA